jgi:DnaK suppressor protein
VKSVAAKRTAKVQAKAPSAKTAAAKPAVKKTAAKPAPVKKSVPGANKKAVLTPVKAKAPAAQKAAPKAAPAKTAAVHKKAPPPKPVAKTPAARPAVVKPAAAKPVAKKQPDAAKKPAAVAPGKKAPATVVKPAAAAVAQPWVAPKILPMPIVASRPAPVAVKKDPKLANNWKIKPIEQWTDAEVIAMPDGEYMNDKQLAFFRLKLVELKNGILANAGQTAENLRDDTVVVPDPADRATIEEEHALELRTRDRERKLLKKIEQSIARIDAGDYGYCDETGEPIGVPRLLARPTATLSLEAQQRREMKQKMFGD